MVRALICARFGHRVSLRTELAPVLPVVLADRVQMLSGGIETTNQLRRDKPGAGAVLKRDASSAGVGADGLRR
jgi:hypothetical protein